MVEMLMSHFYLFEPLMLLRTIYYFEVLEFGKLFLQHIIGSFVTVMQLIFTNNIWIVKIGNPNLDFVEDRN